MANHGSPYFAQDRHETYLVIAHTDGGRAQFTCYSLAEVESKVKDLSGANQVKIIEVSWNGHVIAVYKPL